MAADCVAYAHMQCHDRITACLYAGLKPLCSRCTLKDFPEQLWPLTPHFFHACVGIPAPQVALAQQLIEETWEGGVLALLVNAGTGALLSMYSHSLLWQNYSQQPPHCSFSLARQLSGTSVTA
jgi:hypothetical protein